MSRCLGHCPLVEGVGGARQLDLAVERLVGHTEERAVGNPQAVALRRDGAALHVDADGAGQVDPPPLLAEAELPVAVVVGHHRARAQAPLQVVAGLAGDAGGRGLER